RGSLPVSRADAPEDSADSAEPEAGAPAAACDCPVLEPAEWHEVESDWSDIAFLTASTNAVLGVPVGYGAIRDDLLKRAARAGATVPTDAMLLMGSGRFRRPVMLEVEEVPAGTKGVRRPGGTVYTRLLEVPWGEMRRAVDETTEAARARYGRDPGDVWIWYLTCRECSRERNFETLLIAHYPARE
ncbi:MAG: hydrolase, partial [Tepidiformaceae bacterium]